MWTTATERDRGGGPWGGNVVSLSFHIPFPSLLLLNKLPGSRWESGAEGGEEAVGVRGFSDTWRPCR